MGSGQVRVTFSPEQDKRIHKVARELYEKKYKGQVEKPQETFANDLGVTQPHISDLVNGHTSLSLSKAEKLAKLADFPDLQSMIGPVGPESPADGVIAPASTILTRFPNLNTCLQYHGSDNWPQYVIAIATHGFFGETDTAQPSEWAKRLDELHAYLVKFPRKT